MRKAIITTHPFGVPNIYPIKLLEKTGIEFKLNEIGGKYQRDELVYVLKKEQPDIIIAGTEKYNSNILDLMPKLKMISRVGIGVDSVDLNECKKRGIVVTNTPDAPSNAVAELTIMQIINMLRKVQTISNDLKEKKWNRWIGREIKNTKIGIIGMGRIGRLVYHKLISFQPIVILQNDIDEEKIICNESSKNDILKKCDVITIHIPFNEENANYISEKDFKMMKKDACLINMSRGGIINEKDLYRWLKKNPKASAAIDTFENEPYNGDLLECENAYLTPHIGSCSAQSRFDMEVGAVRNAIEFMNGISPINRVI